MDSMPLVSVVIAVLDGGECFRRCLEALASTQYDHWECIVVDDGSSDGSASLAEQFGARAIPSAQLNGGPAAARNIGAKHARGEVLFFIDADVLVKPETVGRVAANLTSGRDYVACFGSYDDEPAERNFLSQYKNLQHHFVHQSAQTEASTFWTGCGAIRRDAFLALGGFDVAYGRPSIEDIHLGYRVRAAGYRIELDKDLQVKHLKKWNVRSLLTTDIRDRAIPWTRLILQSNDVLNDLNLQTSQRVSSVAVLAGIAALIVGVWFRWSLLLSVISIAILVGMNWPFYSFLSKKRGAWFAFRAMPWHWLYFTYSAAVFITLNAAFRIASLARRVQRIVPWMRLETSHSGTEPGQQEL